MGLLGSALGAKGLGVFQAWQCEGRGNRMQPAAGQPVWLARAGDMGEERVCMPSGRRPLKQRREGLRE